MAYHKPEKSVTSPVAEMASSNFRPLPWRTMIHALAVVGSGLVVGLMGANPAQAITYWLSGNYTWDRPDIGTGNGTVSGYFNYDQATGRLLPDYNISISSAPPSSSPVTINWSDSLANNTFVFSQNKVGLAFNNSTTNADSILIIWKDLLPDSTVPPVGPSDIRRISSIFYCRDAIWNPNTLECSAGGSSTGNAAVLSGTNFIAQVPAPTSAFLLAPLSSLIYLRKRFRKLSCGHP